MRVVVQRVKNASVAVKHEIIGSIKYGLVILLGVCNGDSEADANFLADKCANLRIFEDQNGKLNLSALDVGAEILVVSQFTLYGDCRKGRRPSFVSAAKPEISEPLYQFFIMQLRAKNIKVAEGSFGAKMLVSIHNDGPVTLIIDSQSKC